MRIQRKRKGQISSRIIRLVSRFQADLVCSSIRRPYVLQCQNRSAFLLTFVHSESTSVFWATAVSAIRVASLLRPLVGSDDSTISLSPTPSASCYRYWIRFLIGVQERSASYWSITGLRFRHGKRPAQTEWRLVRYRRFHQS